MDDIEATRQRQVAALRMLVAAIKDAVAAAGDLGAPGGIIYAGLMAHGITLEQYQRLMNLMVEQKLLRRSGELYYLVEPPKPGA